MGAGMAGMAGMALSSYLNERQRRKATKHAGKTGIQFRGCQIDMQGPQLFAKPRHFCKLSVATSRMAFLKLNLHVLQVATSNSNN